MPFSLILEVSITYFFPALDWSLISSLASCTGLAQIQPSLDIKKTENKDKDGPREMGERNIKKDVEKKIMQMDKDMER